MKKYGRGNRDCELLYGVVLRGVDWLHPRTSTVLALMHRERLFGMLWLVVPHSGDQALGRCVSGAVFLVLPSNFSYATFG